ncbi:ABC-three component system protein [uncultured Dokdonia sp.]|uniref:ABC-three component system protein n=1 Tax=uncultured Dokdonia sp. TaxID=575653 RepID=UPI00262A25B9|nr:ABC-three component system protein [uncultured Dokdonia sp.]
MIRENHDAPGQMQGYIYQLERALLQLSQTNYGGMVGVETGDDVVVKFSDQSNSKHIYEQDKHSISNKLPFSDLSKDLWNTLLIWISAIKKNKISVDNSSFLMVTNKKLPLSRFVWKINRALTLESSLECVGQLRVIGAKHNGKLLPTIEKVLGYSDEELAMLILKIHVLDGKTNHNRNEYKKQIKNNLGLDDNLPFNEIYNDLLGWVLDSVIDLWDKNKGAWLKVSKLHERKNSLIARYHSKPFIERAVKNIPINENQRLAEKNKNFVRQLQIIKCTEENILDAIDDYLRASIERTRYAEEARVSSQDFDEFEYNLIERWKNIFGSEVDESKKIISGKKIYFKTTNHKEKLMGVETDQYYTTRGTYQRLSNKLLLGWHPEWKELIEEK